MHDHSSRTLPARKTAGKPPLQNNPDGTHELTKPIGLKMSPKLLNDFEKRCASNGHGTSVTFRTLIEALRAGDIQLDVHNIPGIFNRPSFGKAGDAATLPAILCINDENWLNQQFSAVLNKKKKPINIKTNILRHLVQLYADGHLSHIKPKHGQSYSGPSN